MGGRSGQSVGNSGGEPSFNDYEIASKEFRYSSSNQNKSITERTIDAYTGLGSQINYRLRDSNTYGDLNESDKAFIRNLDKSLQKQPFYNGTVYRGIKNANIDEYKNNKEVTFKGYVSTTKDIEATKSFGKDILFHIKSKSGRDIEPISELKREREVLFERNKTFKIEKVEGNNVYLKEK